MNGEFYRSSEFTYVGENKHFPAEVYRKPTEENPSGKESANVGAEITSIEKKRPLAQKSDSSKSLIKKIFNSIKGAATTAVVTVSAVAVSSTIITSAPKVNLLELEVGHDYVEYSIDITGLDAESNYSLIISAPGKESIESKLSEDGVYEAKVDGLKPQWEYTLSVVCHDTALGDVVHYKTKFQTKKYEEPIPVPPEPPPESYTGTYEVPDIKNATVNWDTGKIMLPIAFENVDGLYYYKLTVTDKDANVLEVITASDSKTAVLSIHEGIYVYSFDFEIYGIGEVEEKLLCQHSVGSYELMPPIAVTDISLSGENTVRVHFNTLAAKSAALLLSLSDGEEYEHVLQDYELERGYADISVPESALTVSVTPGLEFEGYTFVGQKTEHTFDENLLIDVTVDLYLQRISFFTRSITNGATLMKVVSSLAPDSPIEEYLFDGRIMLYYSTAEPISYTMYLSNESGEKLSNEVTVTVDTSVSVQESYDIAYHNPSDILITHNADGTVNAYADFNFSAENENVYYKVVLGKHVATSRDKIFELTGIPNEIMPFEYTVCMDVDGICYAFYSSTPSGAVNEPYSIYANEYTLEGGTLTLLLPDTAAYDYGTARLVSSAGEEIALHAKDFVYDDTTGYITVTATFKDAIEYATLYISATPQKAALDKIKDYKGTPYQQFEFNFYS